MEASVASRYAEIEHEDHIAAIPFMAIAPNRYRNGVYSEGAILNSTADICRGLHYEISLEFMGEIARCVC